MQKCSATKAKICVKVLRMETLYISKNVQVQLTQSYDSIIRRKKIRISLLYGFPLYGKSIYEYLKNSEYLVKEGGGEYLI